MDLQSSVFSGGVMNESHFSKPIHEEADPGAGGPHHLRQGFLRDLRYPPLRSSLIAVPGQQQQYPRQSLFAGVEEVIDKVGSLLGRTQGASKDAGLLHYKTALKLNPTSAIAMVEYANGLVMLEGEKRMKEATRLYEDAAACEPLDAMERLDVEMAKTELED